MARFNLDYYNQIDSYSDGDVEEDLLAYAKGELSWEKLLETGNPYAALYHFSPLRENILNWYPFEKDATVLEIGSGCGAITGILCEKAGKVTSVELSKRRASINYARHKDLDNLEILVGNLNDMRFSHKFDYVVLNGVLEYAMSFTEGDRPYETFLLGIRQYLKEEGHMLIAIENRLGLKYFNGAPEDHTNHYFEGINGYPDNETVRTFSKKELSALLEACGMNAQRFYYPYPDYKFPGEIFTDETILKFGYGRSYVNLDDKRFLLFQERGLWDALTKEEVVASFANSFLVDVSQKPWQEQDKKLYVKINNDRRDVFRIGTSIEENKGEKQVVKYPLCKEAATHIRTLYKNGNRTPSAMFQNLQGVLVDGGGIAYPYLTEKSLDEAVSICIEKKDACGIVGLLHQVFDCYGKDAKLSDSFENESFQRVFGPVFLGRPLLCVQPANIDLICDNIFPVQDGYRVIDGEWVFDMPVPLSFVIWRCINELYTKHQTLKELIDRKRFMEEFSIDDSMSEVFWHWATYFAKEYVGSATLEKYVQPMEMVSVDEILQNKRREQLLCSSLYVDLGQGFSEENKLYSEVVLEDGKHFTITYNLGKVTDDLQQICNLRFDPLEGQGCICQLECMDGMQSTAGNATLSCSRGQVFLTADPIFYMQGYAGQKELIIKGTIQVMSVVQQLEWMEQSTRELRQQNAQMTAQMEEDAKAKKALSEKHEELAQAYQQVVKEIEELKSSRAWKLLNKLKGN